jgi:LPS-assembly lipoprotein
MRTLAAIVALAALAGCGFKPMYAPSAGGDAIIGAVSVGEVSGKSGHAFRTELVRLLAAEGPTTRRLEVTVGEQVAPLGLRVDESASRADLVLAAGYTLYDSDGREIVKGSASATASYDIPVAAYGAAAAQDDARERAGVLLAQRVRTDLAMKLARRARQPPAPAQQVVPPTETPTP